ncbi:hypothetical protein [Planococcus lenghuensis]|uniref:GerMN domain-containing protein n=1 Tax=Planococcus lenghuensis TaxID=2213202 RepID=A0A1Q2KZM3_9BACL|nr:hypothetical protein [Planococcus lenghuensis]AQQ53650.1 hypothetical protein B0X71_11565 [Planococcus lenghuensis]
MAHNEWDDDRIEQLLREFPKIEDHRPKEEVQRRLQRETKPPKRQTHWMPAVVAAAAFLTLGILLASFLGRETNFETAGMEEAELVEEEAALDNGGEEAAVEEEAVMEEEAVEEAATAEGEGMAESAEMAPLAEDVRTAVYPGDLEGYELLSLGLTTEAFVVPVSVLVPSELLDGTEPEIAALYNAFAAEVDEEALGFDDYHPYPGTIASEDGTVVHELPADHEFGLSSATASVYMASLQETFREAEQIEVITETGEQAEIDPIGPVEPITGGVEGAAYFVFTAANGEMYLAPDYGSGYSSAVEALTALQEAPSDLLASPIPEDIAYAVEEQAGTVIVTFAEPLDLSLLDETEIARLFESLALTAGSFGNEVRVVNVLQDTWMNYDLSLPLEPPVAPNKVLWIP